MTAVRFERRGAIYAITLGSYDALVVEVLKATVPTYARSWNKPRREWLIETVYGKPLAEALRQIGCTIVGLDDQPDDPNRHHGPDPAGWARAVFQRVGPNRTPQAYRLLSRICHPDHGGDHQLQLELNQAYAELPPNKRRSA
jgi:hypothetical protein